jgi:hypothetical protein
MCGAQGSFSTFSYAVSLPLTKTKASRYSSTHPRIDMHTFHIPRRRRRYTRSTFRFPTRVGHSDSVPNLVLLNFPCRPQVIFDQIKHARYDFPSPYWDAISNEAKQLVSGMLCGDVASRKTCKQCLDDPWVRKFHAGDLPTGHLVNMQSKLKEFNIARKLKGALNTFVSAHGHPLRPSPNDGTLAPTHPDSLFEDAHQHMRIYIYIYAHLNMHVINAPLASLQIALQRMQHGIGHTANAQEAEKRLLAVKADSERLEELQESFEMLDRDHQDRISVDNLSEFLQMFGTYKTHDEVRSNARGEGGKVREGVFLGGRGKGRRRGRGRG